MSRKHYTNLNGPAKYAAMVSNQITITSNKGSSSEETIKDLNDPLNASKLLGVYPLEIINKYVETWWVDCNQDYDEVMYLINFIEDGRYRKSAIKHLNSMPKKNQSIYNAKNNFNQDNVAHLFLLSVVILVFWYFVVTVSSIEPWVKILMFVFGPIVIGKLSDLFFKTNFIT